MLSNAKKTKDELIAWIKNYFNNNGKNCTAVVGISGGKDSLVTAGLCVEALGIDRVYGVLMPNGVQSDISDSLEIVKHLKIKYSVINIQDSYEGLVKQLKQASENELPSQTIVNLPPRIRMATLYAFAGMMPNGARVANTCNRSEDYIGYSTKYGDSAGDFSPLQNLLVSEVKQIGHELNLPKQFIDKTPSDGLCGKSDEDNLGFTYDSLEKYIVEGTTGDNNIDKIIAKKHVQNLHKLQLMPAFILK